MTTALTGVLNLSLDWVFQEILADGTTFDNRAKLTMQKQWGSGTGVDQNDRVWYGQGTIAATTNLDLDLSGGLTLSLFGTSVPINFVKIKAIVLRVLSTTTGDLLIVGPKASGSTLSNSCLTPFNSNADAAVVVGADSPLVIASMKDGFAVTAGTGDLLRIRNPGATGVAYRIAIIGTSA